MSSFRQRIDSDELFFDSAIVSHGYAPHLRDYDVVIDVSAPLPPEVTIGETSGSYTKGRYRYRFTHCPEEHVTSRDNLWSLGEPAEGGTEKRVAPRRLGEGARIR